MLQIAGLWKSYSDCEVFRDVNLDVSPNQKIGILGPPGSGKTTLLRLILGLEDYQRGHIAIAPGCWFGYLPQEEVPVGHYTVGDVLRTAENDYCAIRNRPAARQLAFGEFEAAEYRVPGLSYLRSKRELERARTDILEGLGLGHLLWTYQMASLQPDEQKRVWLASLLLARPDVLVLDEPTVHLTDSTIEWLEGSLPKYAGTMLLVSSDLLLLDHLVDTLWKIDPHQHFVQVCPGNHRTYLPGEKRVS